MYKYLDGSLKHSENIFHVHFFSWLKYFGPNEVDQIIVARVVMYLFFLGTCYYLFLIARYYLDEISALFSLLCYQSFVFTAINGSSFRHDSIAIFFLMFALYYFLVKENTPIFRVAAGLAIAIAMVFTIKSAIYLATFCGLIVIKFLFSRNFYKTLVSDSIFIFTFFLCYIIINKFHISTIPDMSIATQFDSISKIYSTFILPKQFFPQFKIFLLLYKFDRITWLLLSSGIILLIIDCAKKPYVLKNIGLFSLLIPLFSILIYRNAFPYFYVFAMPPATIFCGYLLWKLIHSVKFKHQIIYFVLIVVFGSVIFKNLVTYYASINSNQIGFQKEILNVIHKMFPDPVPYIDGSFMVSSFPDTDLFLSSAGMEGYLKVGEPIMEGLLTAKKPRFLLANIAHLNLHSEAPAKSYKGVSLMIKDWQILKDNFIHHWGPIWVTGKQFKFKNKNEIKRFKIAVPGIYTTEGNENVLIDGRLIQIGDVVSLKAGDHIIKSQNSPGRTSLRLGENLYRPIVDPPIERIFLGPFL